MIVVSACAWLAWSPSVFALDPALEVNQYAHRAWTIREGSFSGKVSTIAQTPDGFLWLGTDTGLLRFDGVRTVRWQHEELPDTTIVELLVTRDGRLWIGTLSGLASWKDGHLLTYPELAGEVVGSLVEDAQGTVWVGTISLPNARLCAIRSVVQCAMPEGGFGNGVFSLVEARGTLWVGAARGVWRWAPGDPTRYATPIATVSEILKVNDGPLLVAANDGVKQLVGERLQSYRLEGIDRPFQANKLFIDRDGGLWIGTFRQGLIHVHQGRADRFTTADGLSGDTIVALYEDREGNIWVATNEGLDRFRGLAVTTVARKQGLPGESGPRSSPRETEPCGRARPTA